jgi:hypothetical protein
MRITISHSQSKEEVIRSVDRSFDDLFRGIGVIPIQFVNEQRNWRGSTLTFSLSAKMGFVSTPMKGTIEVTDRDITIDADLGAPFGIVATSHLPRKKKQNGDKPAK